MVILSHFPKNVESALLGLLRYGDMPPPTGSSIRQNHVSLNSCFSLTLTVFESRQLTTPNIFQIYQVLQTSWPRLDFHSCDLFGLPFGRSIQVTLKKLVGVIWIIWSPNSTQLDLPRIEFVMPSVKNFGKEFLRTFFKWSSGCLLLIFPGVYRKIEENNASSRHIIGLRTPY